ncbi:MAG TPA: hypothetical protein VM032_01625 [Vicinamibacterales bacterium]|nr:hypothetical protein [Vicinamibacterales bacterium]
MKRILSTALLVVVAAAAIAAQTPAGWKQRLDRSTSASDPDAAGTVKFVTMGTGFHATNPQAAVFWNPANTATGNYTVKASFKLVKPSSHSNYYGLVFGGSELEGPNQSYIYFTVSQDGTWLLKRRDGDANAPTIAARTASDAVKKPGPDGTSVNDLEVRVQASKIDYVVNGTVVHSTPKTGMTARTDGLTGIRVNHMLEVHVDGFSVVKQ